MAGLKRQKSMIDIFEWKYYLSGTISVSRFSATNYYNTCNKYFTKISVCQAGFFFVCAGLLKFEN